MRREIGRLCSATLIGLSVASTGHAQGDFTLTSAAFKNGGTMPENLKCKRDGGEGVSPPLSWSSVPEGTQSLALIMHHYARGKTEGVDAPSHYWLLWNIPADTNNLARGNSLSIGTQGSDKDGRHAGYTAPCSPAGEQHEYTITVFALQGQLDSLPIHDELSVVWQALTDAMQGKIISSSKISFMN